MFFVSLPQVYPGGIEVYPAQIEKGRRVDFEDVLYRLIRLRPPQADSIHTLLQSLPSLPGLQSAASSGAPPEGQHPPTALANERRSDPDPPGASRRGKDRTPCTPRCQVPTFPYLALRSLRSLRLFS